MVHLRVVAPAALAYEVYRLLRDHPSAINVVRLRDVADRPQGDVLHCDVPREDASVVVATLRELGLEHNGSIAVEPIGTLISDDARRAEREAVGSPADAVVWEEVEARTSESAELSYSFLAFMMLATMIAAIGIIEDSQILIVAAMVVGPEFGPIAGLCIAIVQRRRHLAARSLVALAVGFPLAILAALALTSILRAVGSAPDRLATAGRPATLFISHPNELSVLVALLAGIVGALSLTTAKSGALIGVLISVTTIPAAGNIGVALAYADWDELEGAVLQLSLNVSAIIVAAVATLSLQRVLYVRRRKRLRLSAGRA